MGRILDRLIAQSEAGEISWEIGGPEDSYAADVGQMRMRVRSQNGDSAAPFIFEIWGAGVDLSFPTTSFDDAVSDKIVLLYGKGKQAALDPNKDLEAVEQQLGLDSPW
jgi:hypothetical protein